MIKALIFLNKINIVMYIHFLFKYLKFSASLISFCFFYLRIKIDFINFPIFDFNFIFDIILNVIFNYYFAIIIDIRVHIAKSIFLKMNNILNILNMNEIRNANVIDFSKFEISIKRFLDIFFK